MEKSAFVPLSGLCKCLPVWIHGLSVLAQSKKCCNCSKTFQKDEDTSSKYVLMPCYYKPTVVHSVLICAHPGKPCEGFIERDMARRQRTLLYDCARVSVIQDKPRMTRLLHLKCLQHHKLGDKRCSNPICRVYEQPLLQPFLRCNRCRRVFYCNTYCQKEHWEQHKKVCKPTPPCPCMTSHVAERYRRARCNLCSDPSCRHRVDKAKHSARILNVRCQHKSLMIHKIQLHYCSMSCSRDDTKVIERWIKGGNI